MPRPSNGNPVSSLLSRLPGFSQSDIERELRQAQEHIKFAQDLLKQTAAEGLLEPEEIDDFKARITRIQSQYRSLREASVTFLQRRAIKKKCEEVRMQAQAAREDITIFTEDAGLEKLRQQNEMRKIERLAAKEQERSRDIDGAVTTSIHGLNTDDNVLARQQLIVSFSTSSSTLNGQDSFLRDSNCGSSIYSYRDDSGSMRSGDSRYEDAIYAADSTDPAAVEVNRAIVAAEKAAATVSTHVALAIEAAEQDSEEGTADILPPGLPARR